MFKKIMSLLTVLSMTAGMAVLPVKAEGTTEPNAAMEEKAAEMEKAAAEMEKEYLANAEKVKNSALELEERLAGGSVELMSADNARTVPAGSVKIGTVEELMAIDGQSGGIYELTNDIDLSGIEWKPLELNKARLYGNGHTISNIKITDVADFDVCVVGLIGQPGNYYGNNYVYDLTLSNISITNSKKIQGRWIANPIGDAIPENCELQGDIEIEGAFCEIYGLWRGTNSHIRGDINITDTSSDYYRSDIYGIYEGNNCTMNGNIDINSNKTASTYVYGISGGADCFLNGNISGSVEHGIDAEGISDSENSYLCGNVSVQGDGSRATGISSGSGCGMSGSVYSSNFSLGLSGGENNSLFGDVQSEGGAEGITYGKNNYMSGDVTASSGADGISNGEDCYLFGDIEADCANGVSGQDCYLSGDVTLKYWDDGYQADDAYGVYGTNSYMSGDITVLDSTDYAYYQSYVGVGGKGCCLKGDITINAGEVGNIYAINGDNCYMEGDLTATAKGDALRYEKGYAGIAFSDGSYMKGDVTFNFSGKRRNQDIFFYVYSICCSDNSQLIGNFTCTYSGYGIVWVYGMPGCENCKMIGNMSLNMPDYYPEKYKKAEQCFREPIYPRIGIEDAYVGLGNCYFSGSCSVSVRNGSVTVSDGWSGSICADCGQVNKKRSKGEYNGKCKHYGGQYLYTPVCSVNSECSYSGGSSGGTGTGDDPGLPDIPEPTESPEDTYLLQIVDEISEMPYPGAEVSVDGETCTADENGIVTVTHGCNIGNLTVTMAGQEYYNGSYRAVPNRLNIVKVNGLKISLADYYAGNSETAVVKGPEIKVKDSSFNIFELPIGFELNLFEGVEVAYDKDKKIYQVLFQVGQKKEGDAKVTDAAAPAWKLKFSKAKVEYENYTRAIETGDWSDVGRMGFKSELKTFAFLELKPENGGLRLLSGGAISKLSMSYTGGKPIPAYPIIYLSYGFNGEFIGDAKIVLKKATLIHPQFELQSDITAEIAPYVGVGVGLQTVLSAEVGLRGKLKGELNLPSEKLSDNFTANFTGEVYCLLTALIWKAEFCKKFIEAELYPNFGNVELMSVDNINDFELIGRDYLDGVALMAEDGNTVKSNIYPYGTVQTARLDDGRTLVVWLDDDTSRNLINRTALYYSVVENGVMSVPQQIYGDGTADFDFELTASGNKAAIVWQNANTALDETADSAALAAAIELSYAEFDGSAWGSPIAVTSGNSDYEYSPCIYYNGTTAYTAWVQNDTNSTIPGIDCSAETVYSAQISGGAVSEKKTQYENLRLIYNVAVDNKGKAAVIADKSDSLDTSGKAVLYAYGDKQHDNGSMLSGLSYSDNDRFEFTENGNLMKYDGSMVSTIYEGADNAYDIRQLFVSDTCKAVVYEVQDQFTSNLYASYYDGYVWTNPVPITDYNEKIRSWSAELNEDGTIDLAAVLAAVDTDGESISDKARLVYTAVKPIEDIETVCVYSDDAITGGINADINIGIVNNTRNELSEFNVVIKGENTGVLYEGTAEAKISGGDKGLITVSCPIPADFAKQNITAEVTSAAVEEADIANNSASAALGEARLNVKISAYGVKESGTADVTVKNEGAENVSGAILTVTDGNDENIYEENINAIAAGEVKRYSIPIDKKYYTFENSYDSFSFEARVTAQTEDGTACDNTDSCRIEPEKVQTVKLAEQSVQMAPGEVYKPTIEIYPKTAANTRLYCTSSNEAVAAAAEDGTITAVENGTATIAYISPDTPFSRTITVYVHELGAPEIISAEYTENGSEDNIYGYTNVTVNTSSCLAEGEKAKLITAVYAEDGTLMSVKQSDITATAESSGESIQISTSGKKPKCVKVMLWNSLTGMKPSAYSAEREITA